MNAEHRMSACDFAGNQREVSTVDARGYDDPVATLAIHNGGVRTGVGVAVASAKNRIRDANGNFLPFAVCGKNVGEVFAVVGKCAESHSEIAKQVCAGRALVSEDCKRLAEKFGILARWKRSVLSAQSAVRTRKVSHGTYIHSRERAKQRERPKLRKKQQPAGTLLNATPTGELETATERAGAPT